MLKKLFEIEFYFVLESKYSKTQILGRINPIKGVLATSGGATAEAPDLHT
jgi:hypothetical protein